MLILFFLAVILINKNVVWPNLFLVENVLMINLGETKVDSFWVRRNIYIYIYIYICMYVCMYVCVCVNMN